MFVTMRYERKGATDKAPELVVLSGNADEMPQVGKPFVMVIAVFNPEKRKAEYFNVSSPPVRSVQFRPAGCRFTTDIATCDLYVGEPEEKDAALAKASKADPTA